MKPLDSGYYVSLALFLVFCGLSIVASTAERKLSALGLESIAPDNLRRAAEKFRLKLALEQTLDIRETLTDAEPRQVLEALEKSSESFDRIAETESWSLLEADLSAYADRIELLTQQRRFMSGLVHWALLASAAAMLIFSVARTRAKNRQSPQVADGQQPARAESEAS